MGCGLEYGSMGPGNGMSREMSATGSASVADVIASLTRKVADFPKPGILFNDLTPVFADGNAMGAVTDALAEIASGADLVAGIDSRGFLVAAAVAARLRTGVLAVRKGGKLPPPVYAEHYDLEYGSATLEIPAGGIGHRRHGGSGEPVARACGRRCHRGGGGCRTRRAGRSRGDRAAAGAQLESGLAAAGQSDFSSATMRA
jgi:hypothetical protein